jgi:FtsZ-interacting cell division protein ZipA
MMTKKCHHCGEKKSAAILFKCTGKVYRRRFADMFDVEFSFREVKQKLREEAIEEARKVVKEEAIEEARKVAKEEAMKEARKVVKEEAMKEAREEVKKEVEDVREKFEKRAKESAIETVKNLLKNGVSIKIISLSTGLDESAVGEIKSNLALV